MLLSFAYPRAAGDLGPCDFVMWRRQKPNCSESKRELEAKNGNSRTKEQLWRSSGAKGGDSSRCRDRQG